MTKRDQLRGRLLAVALSAAVIVCGVATAGASGMRGQAGPAGQSGERTSADDVIPGRYIVVYEDGIDRVNPETRRREERLGFRSDRRYRSAIEGFAAELAPGQVRALERDPDVAYVSEDRRVRAAAEVPLSPTEIVPTGVRRIQAATGTTTREASGVAVAVMDTGVKLDHSDLVVEDGTDCIDPDSPADDGDGHGTHVAGTIAARNQGAGVVGVAPGTTIHAVRVLDDDGEGLWSQVICGIDWVTANAEERDIGVANMSLGGLGPAVRPCATTTDSIHQAICASTDAGVTYVVAAGNWGDGEQDEPWEFDHPTVPNVPAAYPEVLTVTAMADSNGAPGGAGTGPNCGAPDDAAAPFSNFALTAAGGAHTIAAPGCRIRSTSTSGGSNQLMSGTSMATPHVAGVVALCIDEAGVEGGCGGLEPEQVIDRVRAEARAYNEDEHPGPGAGLGYGFLGDPLNEPGDERYGFLTVAPLASADDPVDPTHDPVDDPLDDPADDSGDPGSPTGDPPGDGAAPPPGAANLPAALQVRSARVLGNRSSRRLIVRGSLDPAAAGERIAIGFRSRGRRIRMRPMIAPNGGFALERRLRGAQRRAPGGRLIVRFHGNETLRAAGQRLRAARRAVRLRLDRNAPRLRAGRVVVGGQVRRRARGRVRIALEFNRPDGSPAEVTALVRVRGGRFSTELRVPPAARNRAAHVSLAHRGRGRLHGQRIDRALAG